MDESRRITNEKPVSFHPITLEQAVSGLLKVKSPTQEKKAKPKESQSPENGRSLVRRNLFVPCVSLTSGTTIARCRTASGQ
jgi:hypothetical protein